MGSSFGMELLQLGDKPDQITPKPIDAYALEHFNMSELS